jgi:two-component system OmpR family sensor kinase
VSLLHSLRARLFAAIGLIVALAVAITLGLGLVLTRRAVEDATLKDLSHQAALIVGEERAALSPLTHLPQLRPYLELQHERYVLDPALLSRSAGRELAQGRPVAGSVTLDGIAYYYAAEPVGSRAFILLRPKSLTNPRWTPFVEAIVIAALAGGVLAAAAAFFLARRIVRPVARVAAASRSLAAGRHPEPVPEEGAAELATLAVAFNDLAEQLARAREAERSFLLSVSHELKTPLTAIAGYAEALREGAVSADDAAETIGAEAERLGRLVGDLLDLARMNRTDFAVHPSEIDLAEVGADAVRRYQQQADGFGVSLTAVSDRSAPAVADADRVLQVVSNLVENALRLTPPGGEVRVVTGPGRVQVEDTGPGLGEDDREHAFERFYLHERYGRERPVGTGLGLAIVRELTLAMGGTVEVASEPGRRTVFTVRLPETEAKPAQAGTDAVVSRV